VTASEIFAFRKKGLWYKPKPLVVFCVPAPALSGSGSMGMFSDFHFKTTPENYTRMQ
jgi:hypothetical protein